MSIKEIINEEINSFITKKLIKEWDYDDDWIHDLYAERDEIMRDTINNVMTKPKGVRQQWSVIPFPRLKKIWEDAAKHGVVRDTKGLQEIQDRMIRNLLKLDINTELMGHSDNGSRGAHEMIEDEGYTPEEFEDKVGYGEYFTDPATGQWRLSDYALKPLWKYAEQLIKEKNPIKKIQYIDQMLNVVHMRSDVAGLFVQGGAASLDLLFNGEQEREWEVHRPM